MLKKSFLIVAVICLTPSLWAGSFGLNVGLGAPYLTQFGVNYVSASNKYSADINYGTITLNSGLSKASLSKPEVNLKWHPFAGAFFLGLGIGQQTLSAEATDVVTGQTAKVEVTSIAVTPNLGFMWGLKNQGFFIGIDAGFQNPLSPSTTITSALPTTDPAYIDAETQAKDLGETAFPVFTFVRIGYLF